MQRVRLIHWRADEAEERAALLRAAGYDVSHEPADGPAVLRRVADHPPVAVVIDLSRLPSQGRDVALGLRQYKSMRRVPFVFVDGDAAKVDGVKALLPDATFTSWSRIRSAIKYAIAHPPFDHTPPPSRLAGYAGAPLVKKLEIRPRHVVALVNAPPDFEQLLAALPEGASLRRINRGRRDVTIWFTTSLKDLNPRLQKMIAAVDRGTLWIVWPKKASGVATDLTQVVVRKAGLAAGLVDYKIAAIDDTWSGLLFRRRSTK